MCVLEQFISIEIKVLHVIIYGLSTAVITDVSVYETNIYKKINLNIKLIQLLVTEYVPIGNRNPNRFLPYRKM